MRLKAFIPNVARIAGAAAVLPMILYLGMTRQTENPVVLRQRTTYRLQVLPKTSPKLSAMQDWSLQYQFNVPPLPSADTWNYKMATIYQWGDVDFDGYGSSGNYKLSDYRFNQIVPQLMLGNVLDGDKNYKPSWSQRNTWVIQAQYYWFREKTATSYAQAGRVVAVNPGDEITTTIRYMAVSGTIMASIQDDTSPGVNAVSTITIFRPFPNDPTLFFSWRDFFEKATAASETSYVLSTPAVDVETYYLDERTMCGLLPLTLGKIFIPGITFTPSAFSIRQLGQFTSLNLWRSSIFEMEAEEQLRIEQSKLNELEERVDRPEKALDQ